MISKVLIGILLVLNLGQLYQYNRLRSDLDLTIETTLQILDILEQHQEELKKGRWL